MSHSEPTMFAGLPSSQQAWAGDPAMRPRYICPVCGRISFNLGDIRERYCGACHQFEQDQSVIRTDTVNAVPPASAIAATQTP